MRPTRVVLAAVAVVLVAVVCVDARQPVPPKQRKVAFLVGVGDYKFNLPNLGKAPENDVTKLAEVLKAGGFKVVVLTGSAIGANQATKANVEARFKALLDGNGDPAKAIGKDDLVLVALCGHGYQAHNPLIKSDEPYFCPLDTKPDDIATMVSLNGLIRVTEGHGATSLFLVDACRTLPVDPNRGLTRTGIQGKKVELPAKTAVLFSCSRGEVAHQSDRLGHGLFTYAVLKVLRGDTGLAGMVSWSKLVAGVEDEFGSDEFRKLIPATMPQSPVEAKGESSVTQLLVVKNASGDRTKGKTGDTVVIGPAIEGSAPRPKDGLVVVKVTPGSPAKAAGLAADDVIQQVNGEVVQSLADWVKKLTPGNHRLKYWEATTRTVRQTNLIKADGEVGVVLKVNDR